MTAETDELLDILYDQIVSGDSDGAVATTRNGLARRIDATALLYDAMIPALEEVGKRFESGEYFLPEMLIAARAMQSSMDLLRPHIVQAGIKPIGTFVMGTVAGDIHDVGKNLVNVMLEGAGFAVVDLGINVPGTAFVEAIERHRPLAVGMSAFLTTTMMEIDTNLRLIEAAGLRDRVKVLIGGAPINQAFAVEVGADGYAPDAGAAVRATRALVGM